MLLSLDVLQKELSKAKATENPIEKLDLSANKTIFNQLYIPLSQGKEVIMGNVDLRAFDYEDIIEFLSGLEDKSRVICLQKELSHQCDKLKADTNNTKQFF